MPDSSQQKTSNSGCNTNEAFRDLRAIVRQFKQLGVRTSLFIDANLQSVEQVAEIGADAIELYTGPYASGLLPVQLYRDCALLARDLGLRVNSGHDLNVDNLAQYMSFSHAR